MFDNLSEKLGGILDRLTGRGALNEKDVDAVLTNPVLPIAQFEGFTAEYLAELYGKLRALPDSLFFKVIPLSA